MKFIIFDNSYPLRTWIGLQIEESFLSLIIVMPPHCKINFYRWSLRFRLIEYLWKVMMHEKERISLGFHFHLNIHLAYECLFSNLYSGSGIFRNLLLQKWASILETKPCMCLRCSSSFHLFSNISVSKNLKTALKNSKYYILL